MPITKVYKIKIKPIKPINSKFVSIASLCYNIFLHMHYIGIDIGGTNIKIGLLSEDYQILKFKKIPTSANLISDLIEQIKEFYNQNVIGIGVGVAGLIDKEGVVIESPNIPALKGISILYALREHFPLKIKIENDATVATLAESYFGDGKGVNRFILITLGTGIGGGLFCENKVYEIPMEAGHTTINYQGKLCSCGNFGCLEIYASGRAIRDLLIEKIEDGEYSQAKFLYEGNFYKISTTDIYRLALEGDNLSRQILKEAGKALGSGLANLINIFAPAKIILSGGLANAKNIYIETAITEAKKRALKGLTEKIEIIQSKLIDSGGVLGSALLLRDNEKY